MPLLDTTFLLVLLGLGVALSWVVGDLGRSLDVARRRREARKWAAPRPKVGL